MRDIQDLKNRRRTHGSTIWHLVVADYFSAKSLVFFVALVYLASLQIGALKIMGDSQIEKKPTVKVELVLRGDGKLLILRDGKYLPIAEEEIKNAVKDKNVIYHTASKVTNPDYGSEYIRFLGLMAGAAGISPGNALNIEGGQ